MFFSPLLPFHLLIVWLVSMCVEMLIFGLVNPGLHCRLYPFVSCSDFSTSCLCLFFFHPSVSVSCDWIFLYYHNGLNFCRTLVFYVRTLQTPRDPVRLLLWHDVTALAFMFASYHINSTLNPKSILQINYRRVLSMQCGHTFKIKQLKVFHVCMFDFICVMSVNIIAPQSNAKQKGSS